MAPPIIIIHGKTDLDEVSYKTSYQQKGTSPAHTVNLVTESDVTLGCGRSQNQGKELTEHPLPLIYIRICCFMLSV